MKGDPSNAEALAALESGRDLTDAERRVLGSLRSAVKAAAHLAWFIVASQRPAVGKRGKLVRLDHDDHEMAKMMAATLGITIAQAIHLALAEAHYPPEDKNAASLTARKGEA